MMNGRKGLYWLIILSMLLSLITFAPPSYADAPTIEQHISYEAALKKLG